MARRDDIAGIAALAGLGMLMANRGAGNKPNPYDVEDARTVDTTTSGITDEMRQRAIEEGNKISEGERVARYKPNPYDVEDARTAPTTRVTSRPTTRAVNKPSNVPSLQDRSPSFGYRDEMYSNEGRQAPVGKTSVTAADDLDVRGMNARASQALADDPLALAGAATGLGAAGYRAYKYGKNAIEAARAAKAAEQTAAAGREAVTNPLMWMAGPKNMSKFAGEVPSAGREAVTNPMAWMAGPKNMSKFAEEAPSAASKAKQAVKEAAEKFTERFKKKPLSEADTTGGAGKYGYKKGGKVKGYAAGGSVSSASRRGDGIATKGKTRGKIC